MGGWMSVLLFPRGEGFAKPAISLAQVYWRQMLYALKQKKKKVIDDKTIGCVKCFIVYRALSHGFMKSRKKLPENRAVRIKIYLIFKVEKTLEEGGEKSCCHGHGILTQCAPFPTPCCCLLWRFWIHSLLNAEGLLTGVEPRDGGQCGSLLEVCYCSVCGLVTAWRRGLASLCLGKSLPSGRT